MGEAGGESRAFQLEAALFLEAGQEPWFPKSSDQIISLYFVG
jgi:hypothetical protein